MAKKKDFSNIVEESFNEGYESEPGTDAVFVEPAQTVPVQPKPNENDNIIEETLSEDEFVLRKILANDPVTIMALQNREDRSTYYLTDFHRACIDIMSHEEGITKGGIVQAALEAYFPDTVKEAGKQRVVAMAIKKLEKAIAKENK